MAVVDRYVDTLHYDSSGALIPVSSAGTYPIAPPQGGARIRAQSVVFTTISGDSAGSVLRLFKNLPAEIVPLRLEIWTGGITSMSANSVGLYRPYSGGVAGAVTAAGAASLGSAIDLSSAVTNAAPKDGLNAVTIDNLGLKRLFELAGDSLPPTASSTLRQPGYDLALVVTSGSCGAAGKIRATLYWIEG